MSAPSRSLQDTVVVVTGAGGGIGGATARLALEAGAKVVAGDIREDAVRPLLDEFGADRVALAIGDVRQEATGDALVAAGVAAFGRVDSRRGQRRASASTAACSTSTPTRSG